MELPLALAVGLLFAGAVYSLLRPNLLRMVIGFGLLFVAGLWLMHIDLNVSYLSLAVNAGIQGLAIGLIWVPLTTATFSTLPNTQIAEGTAVYHLLRNLGSSFFISVCVAEIVRSTGMNYAHLAELLTPYNKILELRSVTGQWNVDSIRGLASLSKEITRQATLIAYLNAFGLFTTACAMTLPLILLMRGRHATT
jgi:DHA2 family multidrug resistance protein